MSEYPEHDKLQKIEEKCQAIGEFLEWLNVNKVCLAEWIGGNLVTYRMSTEETLADYFGIDLGILEKENRHIIALQIELNKKFGHDVTIKGSNARVFDKPIFNATNLKS